MAAMGTRRAVGTRTVDFASLKDSDLLVDAVYLSGPDTRNAGSDPIHRLLPVANMAGFRFAGSRERLQDVTMVVLYSDLGEPSWPDAFDPELGTFTYYGDNRYPGHDLHDTPRKGNLILREAFAALHSGAADRSRIPPFFVFTKGSAGRDVVFRGLAVPGAVGMSSSDDLVAIWRTKNGERFQNYRAVFTILDAPCISRAWLDSLIASAPDMTTAPPAWRDWLQSGRYAALQAPSVLAFRDRTDQMPRSPEDRRLLETVYRYFVDGYAFEACAAALWAMSAGRVEYEMTPAFRDRGRDSIGVMRIGPHEDAVGLEFVLEAKRYSPRAAVGVKGLARLISRMRHRMFGVLVTTSYLHRQAYEELRSDGHPVVVISGRDIVDILRSHGLDTTATVTAWLEANFSPRRL